jgi:hypothetical protein
MEIVIVIGNRFMNLKHVVNKIYTVKIFKIELILLYFLVAKKKGYKISCVSNIECDDGKNLRCLNKVCSCDMNEKWHDNTCRE